MVEKLVVDSRYLMHSERFFLNSNISVPSIMNRIYLCLIMLVFIFYDLHICDCVGNAMSLYKYNYLGLSMYFGLYDICQFTIGIYIIYVLFFHSLEYFLKFQNFIYSTLFIFTYNRNLFIDIYVYIMEKYTNLLKFNKLTINVVFYVIVISILSSIFIYLYNMQVYTEFCVFSKFYIDSISWGLCSNNRSRDEFFYKAESLDYFNNIFGFPYLCFFDISYDNAIIYIFYIIKNICMDIYMLVFILFMLYYYISISYISNIYFNKYICITILRIAVNFIGSYNRNILLVYVFIYIMLLYIIYISLLYVCYIYSILYGIIYINPSSSNILFYLYKCFTIRYYSILNNFIDNSIYFWMGTGCLFYKNYNELFNSVLLELTSSSYIHKCSDFSFISSGYFSIFNMICHNSSIYSFTTSYCTNSLYFTNLMIQNAYKVTILTANSFKINSYREYICSSSTLPNYRINFCGPFIFGKYDTDIYEINCFKGIKTFKYYVYHEGKLNLNIYHHGQYLYDFNNYFNNKLACIRYNIK